MIALLKARQKRLSDGARGTPQPSAPNTGPRVQATPDTPHTKSALQSLMVNKSSASVVSESRSSRDETPSNTTTSITTSEYTLKDGTPITKTMHRRIAREPSDAQKRDITAKCKKVYEVLDWLREHEPAAYARVTDATIREESDRYHTIAQTWFEDIKSTDKLTRARADWLRYKEFAEESKDRFTNDIVAAPSSGAALCFLIHIHDKQKDCSRFTAASNARKALRNAQRFFQLGPSLEIWDSDSVRQMAKQPDDLSAEDTKDAKMGPLHQVAVEALALPGTVLVDRRETPARTFITLRPRPSQLLTPTGGVDLDNTTTQTPQDVRRLFEIHGTFPAEGVDTMGLHMIRLHALRSIWATRNIELHRTTIEEVVPRSATRAPYAKISFLAKNGKIIRSWVPLIGVVPASESWMVPLAQAWRGHGFLVPNFKPSPRGDVRATYAIPATIEIGEVRDFTSVWFYIWQIIHNTTRAEISNLDLLEYAPRHLLVTFARLEGYPLSKRYELGRWAIPLAHLLADVTSISQNARKRLRKSRQLMPNDYSRAAGDDAELTIRTEVVEHLQRNMTSYTDGTHDWPVEFKEWFDFSLARSHNQDNEQEESDSSDSEEDDEVVEALDTA